MVWTNKFSKFKASIFISYKGALIAALGGLLFGYNTGVISGALSSITNKFSLTTNQQEITVSSIVFGALIGALFSSWFIDRQGRRNMLIASAIGFIIGTILTATAPDFLQLILGRLIIGISIGITSYATPLFVSELSPAFIRGTLVLINAVTISGGEALSFLIDYLLAPFDAWRWMLGIGLIPAALFLFGMLNLPESTAIPFNRKKVLRTNKLTSLFSKELRPLLYIGISLGIFQQFFGINTVMYYGPTIFKSIGYFSSSSQLLMTFFMGMVNTIFSVVCFYFIERIGRRKLLITGSAIAAICLFTIAAIIPNLNDYPSLRWPAFLCFVFYIAGYCISVGSLFWLIIAEIFPLQVRGLGMSLAATAQWAANLLVSMTFLSLIHTLGPSNVFMLYSLICLACLFFCYFKIPETTGLPIGMILK